MVVRALLSKLKLTAGQGAYMGDDLIDAPVMDKVGLSVADAYSLLRPRVDHVSRIAGCRGAVREVCDLLRAKGKLEDAKGQSV